MLLWTYFQVKICLGGLCTCIIHSYYFLLFTDTWISITAKDTMRWRNHKTTKGKRMWNLFQQTFECTQNIGKCGMQVAAVLVGIGQCGTKLGILKGKSLWNILHSGTNTEEPVAWDQGGKQGWETSLKNFQEEMLLWKPRKVYTTQYGNSARRGKWNRGSW